MGVATVVGARAVIGGLVVTVSGLVGTVTKDGGCGGSVGIATNGAKVGVLFVTYGTMGGGWLVGGYGFS